MGPVFARAKKTFYVVRCVGDKNQGMECAVHNFKEWSVLGTNLLFGSVPHTNFPNYNYLSRALFYVLNILTHILKYIFIIIKLQYISCISPPCVFGIYV